MDDFAKAARKSRADKRNRQRQEEEEEEEQRQKEEEEEEQRQKEKQRQQEEQEVQQQQEEEQLQATSLIPKTPDSQATTILLAPRSQISNGSIATEEYGYTSPSLASTLAYSPVH